MANTDFPSGFEPVKYVNGGDLSCETGLVAAANAEIGYFQPIEMHTDGYLRPAVAQSTTIVGVSAEHKAANAGGAIKYYPADGLVMRAQASAADIADISGFELTWAMVATTPDTTTFRSKYEIDSATSHATDYPIVLRNLAPATDTVGNAYGANAVFECVFNSKCIR